MYKGYTHCSVTRKCRYSGARRGIGGTREHWEAPKGCRGLLGHQGV